MTTPVLPPDASHTPQEHGTRRRPGFVHIPAQTRREATPPAAASPGLRQPAAGLAGLGVVLLVVVLVGVAPGPQSALERLAPAALFCLPLLGAFALWWDGLVSARPGRAAAGAAATAVIVGGGALLTVLGQTVVGGPTRHLFGLSTETAQGHLVTFPWVIPLAASIFAVMLQFTLVCAKRPFARLSPLTGGFAAIGTSWVIGTGAYLLLANWDAVPAPARAAIGLRNPGGPVDALDLTAFALCIIVLQLTFFLLLAGWPVSMVANKDVGLVLGNALTLGGGWLGWLLLSRGFDLTVPQIAEITGAAIAGILVTGLLFEGWPARMLPGAAAGRIGLVAVAATTALVTGLLLRWLGNAAETWTRDPVQLWTGVMGILIGATVILFVAVWRRWPLRVEAA